MASGETNPITAVGSTESQSHVKFMVRRETGFGVPVMPAVVPGLDAWQPPMGD
jgi:hypothetical protein